MKKIDCCQQQKLTPKHWATRKNILTMKRCHWAKNNWIQCRIIFSFFSSSFLFWNIIDTNVENNKMGPHDRKRCWNDRKEKINQKETKKVVKFLYVNWRRIYFFFSFCVCRAVILLNLNMHRLFFVWMRSQIQYLITKTSCQVAEWNKFVSYMLHIMRDDIEYLDVSLSNSTYAHTNDKHFLIFQFLFCIFLYLPVREKKEEKHIFVCH